MKKQNAVNKNGFTLLELLVVVLIIGILAAIALPQYENAVTKSRVMSMLPLMRRWKDALQEWKLQHGTYCKGGEDGSCEDSPDGADLGVNWPSDWNDGECGDDAYCSNDYWTCLINAADDGSVNCDYKQIFSIIMNQPDGEDYCGGNQGKIICLPWTATAEGEKICKNLGKASGTNGNLQCTVIGS